MQFLQACCAGDQPTSGEQVVVKAEPVGIVGSLGPPLEPQRHFEAIVHRSAEEPLGVNVDRDPDGSLIIREIRTGGCVFAYNSASAVELKIRVGQRILKVNGVGGAAGEASAMVREAQEAKILHLEIISD
uniref:PDZ domain-containing protein n=2 Tax=Oxyrrhis marina TaxID=2969 RepID=A0A7S3UKH4_OXYMA